MTKDFAAGLAVFVLGSVSASAQTPTIDHQPVGCVVADRFPRLEARFASADTVAAARAVFQGANVEQWYSVAMKPEGAAYFGTLPKPKKSLKALRYYIEVTDRALGTSRTADYTASVVRSSSECKGGRTALALGSASLVLQGPAGAAALPAGFASTGVVAGSAAGSSSAAGAAGAAGGCGGGLSGGAVAGIVGGVGAAAAGVAVVAAKSGGGDGGSNNSVEGNVYRGSNLGSPISGAIVSTSLDSRTAITDGAGHFFLQTDTGGNVQVYRLTITAAGCQTYSNESRWGAKPTGLTLNMTCP